MNQIRQPNGDLVHSYAGSPAIPPESLVKNSENLRYLWSSILVAAIYFAAAKLGLSFAFIHTSVSPVWAPTGVAIAAILLLGYRMWPSILLAALSANLLFTPAPVAAAAGIAVGNTLEALTAGIILRSFDFDSSFDSARDVSKFVFAALLSTMVSATVGNLSLCLSHAAAWENFGALWLTWWLGDSIGGLVVAPLLLTWGTRSREWLPRKRYGEAVLVLALLSLAAIMTFGVRSPVPVQFYPLVRLTIPFFIWAAFRLGNRGVTLATAVFSAIAIWGTAIGLGPFSGRTTNESLLQLQMFVGSNAIMFMFLVAVVEERRRSEESLRESQNRLATDLAVTQILAESPAVSEATARILQTVGETLGCVVGDVWTPDAKTGVLRCLKIWHAPSAKVEKFVTVSRERTFAPGIGLPGRVWESLKPAWIPDVTKDDNFPRAPYALAERLHGAFAFPILSGNEFLAVMEFFSHEIREPDQALLAMLDSIGSQIGQFIKRKQAEESVVKNQEALRLAHKVVKGGTWQSDLTTNTVAWSEEYYELIGLDPAVTPASVAEWSGRIHPHDLPAVLQEQDTAVAEKRDVDVEFRIRRPDGEWRWFHQCGRCIYDTEESPVSIVGITFDVTERKEAEDALRESQAQLANMISSATDTVITINEDQRIVIFNAAAERMFGCSAQEAIGEPIGRFIPKGFRTPHQEDISSFGETGVTERSMGALGALFGVRANGEEFPIEASISQTEARGQKLYTVILRDITERQRAEQEREELLRREHAARAEAEEANRTKDQFLATLSHELRTPMNAIIGWSSMLRTGKLDGDTAHRAIEIVERNAKVQAQLIDDLLDVSGIVSGKLRVDRRAVQLSHVMEAAVDSIRPAADSKNIRLQLLIDPKTGPVSGDPDRLQQIFWNLLSNAVKFTNPEGEINVHLHTVDSHVEIVVRDTGQGIRADFLPHVFDRFRQADATMTRKQRGLGLGLAIVRHLVELHDGTVKAESAGEDKGATFRVSLPLLPSYARLSDVQPRQKAASNTNANNLLRGLRMLFVDDEADAREFVSAMLSKCDVEVRAAASATDAFAILEEWLPDVLISDIEMPEMDGHLFIREVRQRYGHIPAIALTAHARVEDRLRALEAGFQVHVAKPMDPSELAQVIARLSGRME